MATKTLVTTFEHVREAEDAVHALHEAGFARDDVGWITRAAHDGVAPQGPGGVASLLIGVSARVIPGVGPVVVAGPILSALAGATADAAAGGLIDALANAGVPTQEAERHAERLRRGGAIVTITVDDLEEEAKAVSILRGDAIEHGHDQHVRIPPRTDEPRVSSMSIV